MFIVGGTGISGALPYLQDHVVRTAARPPTTRMRDITLLWTAKQSAMICDIATLELRPLLGRQDVHFGFHAASRGGPLAIDDFEKPPIVSTELKVSFGRPNVRDAVPKVIEDVSAAGLADGRIAILACGSAALVDEARAAVRTALKRGKWLVEYFEETFVKKVEVPD